MGLPHTSMGSGLGVSRQAYSRMACATTLVRSRLVRRTESSFARRCLARFGRFRSELWRSVAGVLTRTGLSNRTHALSPGVGVFPALHGGNSKRVYVLQSPEPASGA